MAPVTRPDWDGPPDGDYAAYIERLRPGSAGLPLSSQPTQAHEEHTRLPAAPSVPQPPAPAQGLQQAVLRWLLRLRLALLLIFGAQVLWALYARQMLLGEIFATILLWLSVGVAAYGLRQTLAPVPQSRTAKTASAGKRRAKKKP